MSSAYIYVDTNAAVDVEFTSLREYHVRVDDVHLQLPPELARRLHTALGEALTTGEGGDQ